MYNDLENRIDTLIQKATKDLKTRIVREVNRSINKILKENSRGIKSSDGTTKRGRKADASYTGKSKSRSKDRYDSDSDYYSD